ncbi:MAG: transposase [Pseudomonadota bacterium]
MPYLPRYFIICDDSYFHVTWQCHNQDWLLKWDWAKEIYYNLLRKYKDKYGVEIYAYNFMDNHPHLAGHLRSKDEFSAFFRLVNGLFAKAVNKRLNRKGQVIMDRFKSPRIESDNHLINVMTYIDLNQQRVGKVDHPKQNTWSSYRYYAYGQKDSLITPSPSYLLLGRTPTERQNEYRRLVEGLIGNDKEINISKTYFIGNPDWVIARYKEYRILWKTVYIKQGLSNANSPPG